MKEEKAYRQLVRWVKRIIAGEKPHPMTGVVNSVDGRLAEVQPDEGGPPLDCRLQSVEKGKNGLVLKPKKDSTVIYEHLDKETGVVLATMDVEEVLLDCDTITINGGDNDGLVIVGDLVDRLNAIEDAHNQLVQSFNTHTHAGVTSGSSSTATPAPPSTDTVSSTSQSQLENTKVKH